MVDKTFRFLRQGLSFRLILCSLPSIRAQSSKVGIDWSAWEHFRSTELGLTEPQKWRNAKSKLRFGAPGDRLRATSLMNNHLVLIFAYHFPPENSVGGARPFRFSKYLSRLGYTCRVITAARQSDCGNPNTEYVLDPFVALSQRNFRWQLERAVRKLFFPGELGSRWSYRACKVAREHVRAHPTSRVTVFSTFPPLGPHLAASQLFRSERIRWIADFRDPFPDRHLNGEINFLQERIYRWSERLLVRRADAVVANTDSALLQWQRKYPSLRAKIHLIWNGFDPEERVQALPIPLRSYRQLSHVGELYNGRNATPILESVGRLIAAGRLGARGVFVRLIGPIQPGSVPGPEFLDRANEQGWLELVNKQIPQREARQIIQTSDGLLLLQPQSAVQVPAKLFEYLQIGRPILAFIQPDSPVERLLKRSGVPYQCVYPGSTSETIDAAVTQFFDLPSTSVAPSPWFEEQFNAEHQARMLDALIRSLHGLSTSR
jgi:glycosyltransferase involved in cell wall biosynthesis